MDPIGTVRREDHGDGSGHTIWLRQDPGYPDSELTDTEWTCLWSTATGNIGVRHGDDITTCSTIIGQVPGSPAETGEDVEFNDVVLVPTSVAIWNDEDVRGRVVGVRPPDRVQPIPSFAISGITGDGRNVWLARRDFTLIGKDES